MPSTTSYRSGKDFRVLVQEAIAAQERLRAAEPTRVAMLRAGTRSLVHAVSGIGLWGALRARLARQTAFCAGMAAVGAEKIRLLPSKFALPRLAKTRRDSAPVETQRAEADWSAELSEADWSADLAKEYAEHFAPAPPHPVLRNPAFASRSRPAKAHRIGLFFLGASRVAWRAGAIVAPPARFLYARRGLVLKATAIFVAVLAAADILSQWPAAAPVQEAPPPAPPRAAWLDIAKPLRVYDLSAPLLSHEKLVYAARRHSTGGGREDSLTFGEFAGKKLLFRLTVYRHGEEKAGDPPFFVDLARHAAPLGLSLAHMRLEAAQSTRFGDLEIAALTLSEKSLSRDNCRGFRLVQSDPGLTLAGLACAAGDESLSGQDVACLVNRLDLLAAGNDRPLRDFFGAAQVHGVRGCGEIAHRH